jgi:DNA polymerase elongation subunit (family B)
MAPFIIAGYDIECVSCDENFPQANRKSDTIVQIGITLYRYGSLNCYESHILTLNQCDDIEGVNVECYKTEQGLLKGFAKKMRLIRPDFMVGYRNFCFDDKYIFDRIMRIDEEMAKEKKINVDMLKDSLLENFLNTLGKLNNKYVIEKENVNIKIDNLYDKKSVYRNSFTCYKQKDLNSSALGDNELLFFKTPGIISIDMLKIIERDHKLSSYKLDDVSAYFITEKFAKIVYIGENQAIIYTESTKGLDKNAYIQIMVDDGYSPSRLFENKKFIVDDLIEKTENKVKYQCILINISDKDTEIINNALLNPLLKTFWTFAKDDIKHTLINEYFKNSDYIGIKKVAVYCVKDCKLVNLLMAKLEVIANSTGMAKVCHIPLSYIFLRGQGVKIFSLVAKKCREKNFLIPVLKHIEEDDEYEKYEGATVIKPQPNVYINPITVLDFNSLYPNSMRERNLSPECYVNNPNTNNLSGYIYHDVYVTNKNEKGKIIRNLDGTPQQTHHRYAQEIITDDKINIELKKIFDEIKKNEYVSIDRIKQQKHLTIGQLEQLTEKNEDVVLSKLLLKIKKEKNLLNDTIKEIEEKEISQIKKNKLIEKEKNSSNENINEILNSFELPEKYIKILIQNEIDKTNKKINDEKQKRYNKVNGHTVKYGILPEILTELLNARKETNAILAQTTDPFKRAILNSLQLAFKVTANSLYGQTGAPTSSIYFVEIAASTTAIGRERLYNAKDIVEKNFKGSEIIYGDTDSIFIDFNICGENGEKVSDKKALELSIKYGQEAADLINANVPKPQAIAYEKTFQPFILVTKKKYVGLMFEKDPNKYKMKSMGIVLKRRDNAPIVKIVIGGIIDFILKSKDIDAAVKYTYDTINSLMKGDFPIDKFIVSKNLKGKYKNPLSIAHKVLADRMGLRDPGNKPQINDRIPYVYIVKEVVGKNNKKVLQGDIIENPTYVIENNLKIDYLHYLNHQIIQPASQILELMIEKKDVDKFFNAFVCKEEMKRRKCGNLDKWVSSDSQSKTRKSYSYSLKNTSSKTKQLNTQDIRKWNIETKQKTTNVNKKINVVKKKSSKIKQMDITKWVI